VRYKPKSIAALHIALGGLPDKMRVELETDIGASPKTVGELRKLTAWPENVVVTTPQELHRESPVKVSKASVATRVSPKQ
jgi:CO dehydrogenase/acetyl-CoA synthase alpha subunit